jgi:two-component system chemotaxis response regulator CheB
VAKAIEIGPLLGEMSRSSAAVTERETMGDEGSLAGTPGTTEGGENQYPGPASVFTCPECHGTIFVTEEAGLQQFRCRVGHRFSAESLLDGESEAVDAALWSALRSLQERNDLLHRLTERARQQGQLAAAERFAERLKDGRRDEDVLRRLLLGGRTAEDEPA